MAPFARASRFLRHVVKGWSKDQASDHAASLAFYTMLSIAPLLILCMRVAGALFGEEAANDQIAGYLHEAMGPRGARAAEEILEHAAETEAGTIAAVASVAVLLVSASGVFRGLKDSLNAIWNLPPPPVRGFFAMLRARFLSVSMVVGAIFLLLVSLVASTMLTGFTQAIGLRTGVVLGVLTFVASIAVVTGLFALVFRYVADARVPWRDAWVGAAVTAVLFTAGKWLLAWYLGRATATSMYGAAGSLVAMLIWVYYSAQILFFGAEFTQAWAAKHGRRIEATYATSPPPA